MLTRLALLTLVATVSSCVFFEDNDDDHCEPWEATMDQGEVFGALRNPTTGLCEPNSFGGGGSCNERCGPCPVEADPAAVPDWGHCYTQCESLDEGSCKAAAGCRAAYEGSAFHQCWSVAQSGPIQGGGCVGLDAYQCSRHDDCVAIHDEGTSSVAIGEFMACAAETADGPGSCVGEVACDQAEPVCPPGTIAGRTAACWTGYCIPHAQCDSLPACSALDESACIDRGDCAPIYEGKGCTCNGQSCTCQSWTFDSCKAE